MIRALRDRLRRPDFRRIVGFVALLAFTMVVVLGAAHASDPSDADHEQCGVCLAVASIGTSESFAAPQLVAHLDAADPAPLPHVAALIAAETRRSHAPRAPPSLA